MPPVAGVTHPVAEAVHLWLGDLYTLWLELITLHLRLGCLTLSSCACVCVRACVRVCV